MFGHLTARTDALGRRTTFRYNDVGLLVEVEDHGGRALQFEYDDSQLLLSAIQPNGSKIQWEYDHLRRIISPAPTPTACERAIGMAPGASSCESFRASAKRSLVTTSTIVLALLSCPLAQSCCARSIYLAAC
ncbi:hypothetical protein WK03_11090 [Burkholderia cepacia]|nr:hypothetical protein WK03_11090 [Burkholderia cepacia]